MPQSLELGEVTTLDEMFEEHLSEIALDWVREPRQTLPLGAQPVSPANGFITLLAKSQAELIDLTALSGKTTAPASPTIDLTHEPVVMQHAMQHAA